MDYGGTPEFTEAQIPDHSADWSRVGVDNGHFWRFPPSARDSIRLTTKEIEEHLPDPAQILRRWQETSLIERIPIYDERLVLIGKWTPVKTTNQPSPSSPTCDTTNSLNPFPLSIQVFGPFPTKDTWVSYRGNCCPRCLQELSGGLGDRRRHYRQRLRLLMNIEENVFWAKEDVIR